MKTPLKIAIADTGCIDPRYFRHSEAVSLLGDPGKSKTKPGWMPEITAQEMFKEIVADNLAPAKQHVLLKWYGYQGALSVE